MYKLTSVLILSQTCTPIQVDVLKPINRCKLKLLESLYALDIKGGYGKMNFATLNMKLVKDNAFYDVLIRLDDTFATEFGEEFTPTKLDTKSANIQSLCEHIRHSFPDKQLRYARILLHGMTLATLPLATRDEELAQNTRFFGIVSSYEPHPESVPYAAQMQDYTVKFGDTLWIIAAKFNTTADTISEINKLQTTTLDTGKKISVPLHAALPDLY